MTENAGRGPERLVKIKFLKLLLPVRPVEAAIGTVEFTVPVFAGEPLVDAPVEGFREIDGAYPPVPDATPGSCGRTSNPSVPDLDRVRDRDGAGVWAVPRAVRGRVRRRHRRRRKRSRP